MTLDVYTGRAWRTLRPAVINQIGAVLPVSGLTAAEAYLPIAVIDKGGPIDRFYASARFCETGWTVVVGREGDLDVTAPPEVAESWKRAGGDASRQGAVRSWWKRYLRIRLVDELTACLLSEEAELSWLVEEHRFTVERLEEMNRRR